MQMGALMKKYYALIIVFFCVTMNGQQRTFLGLTLGNNYTETEVRSIIPETTNDFYRVSSWADESESVNEFKSGFETPMAVFLADAIIPPVTVTVEPKQKSKNYPEYRFNFTTTGELRWATQIYDTSCGLPSVVFQQLADSLSSIYSMTPIEGSDGLQCLFEESGLTISLAKEEGNVMLLFADMSSLRDAVSTLSPTIQDTFLGLKLGNKYTLEKVKALVGIKGDFLNSNRTANGTLVSFKKVAYAGKIWDFGEILLSHEGEFSKITIYDSLEDFYEERNDAKSTYDSYKESLDKKYRTALYPITEEKGQNFSSTYLGSNGIALELYSRRGKTANGNYRRFVGLDYTHLGILNRNLEAMEDEL